jgi:Domain of unknown function (DUF1844)
MSDTPKFEVIDRRKMKAQEEQQGEKAQEPKAPAEPAKPQEPTPGPRLVASEPPRQDAPPAATPQTEGHSELPPAPTAQESREQKEAYDASSQRLEDLVRAQNPGAGAPPPVTFEHLVQQLYVSALIQMGAGAQEGQRPQVDILGARSTIDLLGILAEKTRGNLNQSEERVLQTVLYELRMAFLELTGMISMPGVPPTPPPAKH